VHLRGLFLNRVINQYAVHAEGAEEIVGYRCGFNTQDGVYNKTNHTPSLYKIIIRYPKETV
jgi:hypothetical protein